MQVAHSSKHLCDIVGNTTYFAVNIVWLQELKQPKQSFWNKASIEELHLSWLDLEPQWLWLCDGRFPHIFLKTRWTNSVWWPSLKILGFRDNIPLHFQTYTLFKEKIRHFVVNSFIVLKLLQIPYLWNFGMQKYGQYVFFQESQSFIFSFISIFCL